MIQVPKQQHEEIYSIQGVGGTKQTHISESSNLDEEVPIKIDGKEMAIAMVAPNHGGWRKVEKNKGKRGR